MKIAQCVATFPPYHGGMGYICYYNSHQLATRGHEVTVFTLAHGPFHFDSDPEHFKVIRLKAPIIHGDGGLLPQLYTKLRGFDVIHLHYPFFGGAEYAFLSALAREQKLFLTYHMDVYGESFVKQRIINAYEFMFMKRILQRADRICSPGVNYLKSTKAGPFINWNKAADVTYGGVDADKFSPRPKDPELLKKYGIDGKIVALFVGNLQPFKGLHLLIDAVAKTSNKDIVLLVIGGGYGENIYKDQVRKSGLEGRVIFAGPKSPDYDLNVHYNLGDFLVLPSTHSESFGLVVLEAMASGLPVIVSDLPGPSSLIKPGEDGLITRIGDVEDLERKILMLAQNGKKRREMGRAARNKVLERYTWSRIGDELDAAMRKLMRK